MGNCCLPTCDQDQLNLSIDKRESCLEYFKPNSETKSKKLLDSQQPENPLSLSFKVVISNVESTQMSKFDFTGACYSPINKASSPICRCGTKFIWQEDLANLYFKITSKWNMPCTECQKLFSSRGLHCPSCNSVVCQQCSIEMHPSIPILKCPLGHELEYSQDTIPYTLEKCNKKTFNCEKCQKDKIESSFTCRTCKYNICINCSHASGSNMNNLVSCYGKHELLYKNLEKEESLNTQCSLCFKGGCKDIMHCEECEFYACFYCIVNLCSDRPLHPGITCKYQHVLMLESMKKVKKNRKKWIICLRCGLVNMKYVYVCKECQECLCMDCAKEVRRTIGEFNYKPCARGHFYIWNPEGVNRIDKCFFCSTKLEFSGFYCEICAHAVCVECIQYSNSFTSRYSSLSAA